MESDQTNGDCSAESATMLTQIVREHIASAVKNNDVLPCCWEIRHTKNRGRALFATRDIEPNEIVFKDPFLIIGPNSPSVCVNCYVEVNTAIDVCRNGCGLPICVKCQSNERHQLQECRLLQTWKPINSSKVAVNVVKNLAAIRSLFLNERQLQLLQSMQANRGPTKTEGEIPRLQEHFREFPVDDAAVIECMKLTVAVINTCAFQTMIKCENGETEISLKGIYPLTALMNHSCIPNTRHSANSDLVFVIAAVRKIQQGDEITSTYSQYLWNTPSRRLHLAMTKQFMCTCPRCSSPTEFDTFLSSFYCTTKTCSGLLVPTQPLNLKTSFQCNGCQQIVQHNLVAKLQEMLPAVVSSQTKDKCTDDILGFLNARLLKLVPPQNQFVMDVKICLIWKIKCNTDTSLEHIQIKYAFCKDVLEVLQKLGAGECILQGLVAFELHRCAEILGEQQDKGLLQGSWTILKDNIARPAELINFINKKNLN